MTSGVNPAYFLRPIFEDTSHVEATLKVACDSFMRPGPISLFIFNIPGTCARSQKTMWANLCFLLINSCKNILSNLFRF